MIYIVTALVGLKMDTHIAGALLFVLLLIRVMIVSNALHDILSTHGDMFLHIFHV